MPAARLFPDSNRARGFQVTWGGYLWVIAQVGRYPDAGDLADSVNVYTMIEASVMAKANATATKIQGRWDVGPVGRSKSVPPVRGPRR